MHEEVYAITDLSGYVSQMRDAAANSLCEDQSKTDNLDDYISLNQMVGLVKQHCAGFDDENRPLVTETNNEQIFEQAAIWIHNIGLAKLAGLDLIECAWDNESNEMVFWAKEPEKKSNVQKKPRRKNKRNKGSDSGH